MLYFNNELYIRGDIQSRVGTELYKPHFHYRDRNKYPPDENPPLHVFIFMEKAMFPLQDLFNCLIKMRAQVPSSRGLEWMVGIISAVIHLHSFQIIQIKADKNCCLFDCELFSIVVQLSQLSSIASYAMNRSII